MARRWLTSLDKPRRFVNVSSPLTITTPDGGGQTIQHDIVDMGSGNTFGGHRFWMATSPFPVGNKNANENPCILYSDDGTNWSVPNGLTNPVVAFPGGDAASNYNSDPGLAYCSSDKKMYLFNRQVVNDQENLYVLSSSDGVIWSSPVLILSSSDLNHYLNPTVVYDERYSKFLMWCINATGTNTLWKFESTDALTWTEVGQVYAAPPRGYTLWHANIKRCGDYYIGVINAYSDPGGSEVDGKLFYMESLDSQGNGWYIDPLPILKGLGSGTNFDSTALYQSCLVAVDNQWWLYYTGFYNDGENVTNKMGLTKIMV